MFYSLQLGLLYIIMTEYNHAYLQFFSLSHWLTSVAFFCLFLKKKLTLITAIILYNAAMRMND